MVYADWLDDRGQPGDADRAEFIRAQVELARLNEGDARCAALTARTRELLNLHREEWNSPLTALGAERVIYNRGLPQTILMKPARFLESAQELFRRAPSVTELYLSGGRVSGSLVQQLAACPQLENLTVLQVEGGNWRDRLTAALVASPHLKRLQELHIRQAAAGIETARAVAAAAHLSELRVLDLAYNRIGTAGATALAGSLHLRNLTTLGLIGNDLRDEGALAFAESLNLESLEILDVAGNRIGNAGVQALVRSHGLRGMKALGLTFNAIDPEVEGWATQEVRRRDQANGQTR